MKDYYDLYTVLHNEKYDATVLQEAIMRTFENRHTPYDSNTMFFRKEFSQNQQMQIRWQAFVKKITKKSELTFAEVVTYIQVSLQPYWDNLSNEES